MASQIRISPDQMRERANSYQTESGNVSEMIGRLDSLLQSLLGEWEGSASEAYRERYEVCGRRLRRQKNCLRRFQKR